MLERLFGRNAGESGRGRPGQRSPCAPGRVNGDPVGNKDGNGEGASAVGLAPDEFQPIEDYACIGDGRTVALVSQHATSAVAHVPSGPANAERPGKGIRHACNFIPAPFVISLNGG